MELKRYEMSGKENTYSIINMHTAYLLVDLCDSIDINAMQTAVEKATKHHPLFATKIIFDGGLFYFEENPMPPMVFMADNAPKLYANESNNHYPWLITIKDNRFIFYNTHALTDGTGIFSFCKTVLHLYFEEMGVKFSDNKTDFPNGTPEETIENSIAKYYDLDCKALGTPNFDMPTLIDPKLIKHRNDNKVWRLLIHKQEISKFAKESETSVFSVIACILARSMAKAYNIKTGNISVRVPVNLRSAFPSITDRNFVQGFSLCYKSERMNDMSDALIETAFRSQLDLWIDKSNLTQVLNYDIKKLAKLKKNDGSEIKAILDLEKPMPPKADILYTHITRPGFSDELMSRIDDMYIAENKVNDNFVSVFASTVNDEIGLTIQQCSINDCYINELRNVLNERKIEYKLNQIELAPYLKCEDTSKLIKQ